MQITPELIDRMNANSLYTTLGIRLDSASQGTARSRLKPEPGVCWPFPGQPHGGILFTLMDTTMAWSILSQLDEGLNCATIHLDIQYTAPARDGSFSCDARVTHQTGRTVFAAAEISDGKGGLVASGQATFRIFKYDML